MEIGVSNQVRGLFGFGMFADHNQLKRNREIPESKKEKSRLIVG